MKEETKEMMNSKISRMTECVHKFIKMKDHVAKVIEAELVELEVNYTE